MRRAAAILVLAVAAPSLQAQPARYDGQRVVRAEARTLKDLRTILALTDDVWSHRVGIGGPVDIRVRPEQLAALAVSGVPYSVIVNDVQASVDAERAKLDRLRAQAGAQDGPGWFDAYHTLTEVRSHARGVALANPALASYQVLGQSLEGREIFALSITGAGGTANKPQLLFMGGQHAREWVSISTVMYIADKLIALYGSDPRVTAILDNLEFVIVPVVNPDGYEYTWTTDRLWRKNRRDNGVGTGACIGVDTNRNWGHQWGGAGAAISACEETYRGPSAFSEPETQVIRDFCNASPRLKAAIDFHSYSQLVMSPWGYTSALPANASFYNQLTSSIRNGIRDSGGLIYTPGPVYSTIYPASGIAVDWWHGGRGVYGLTIELRDTGSEGFLLPPEDIVPTGDENFAGVQALADYFMPVRFWLPSPVPAPLTPGATTSIQVGISGGDGWTVQPGSARIYTRHGNGPFTQSSLVPVGGDLYQAVLPAVPCGETVEFYFEAAATGGPTLVFPAGATPLHATAYQSRLVFADDMEADRGWTVVNGPNLATGAWERADPVSTFNLNNDMANPEDDASPSPGVNCYATQNGAVGGPAGLSDVDDDVTRLVSPPIDLSGSSSAKFTFSRWVYSANGQPDPMTVEVSADGSSWVQVDRITTTNGWTTGAFLLPPSVPVTSTVRVRFSIADEPFDSLTEAAVDEFRVEALECPVPCIANCDGSSGSPLLTPNDFQCFLNAYAAGQSAANCDGSTGVPALTPNDFQCFVNAYAAGCP
jgi:carboxypeptidase A2